MRRQRTDALAAFLIGAAVMWIAVGLDVVLPTNTSWLLHKDAAANFIGWEAFRQSPWTFPLGTIQGYGAAGDTSIVFTDAIPVLALTFKLFQPVLSQDFQYFGIWLMICFVMQAWFGMKLASLFTSSLRLRCLTAALLCMSPAMLSRLLPDMTHLALTAHFLVLAAIYLALRPIRPSQQWSWTLLLGLSLLVHAYIFAMVFAVWIADLFDRRKAETHGSGAIWLFLKPMLFLLLLAAVVGYFTVDGGGGALGFGWFRASVSALFDGRGTPSVVWSRIIPFPLHKSVDREGFAYLGTGTLLLVFIGAFMLYKFPSAIRGFFGAHKGLVVAAVCLALFSFSNRIGTDVYTIELPLPHWLFELASVFRASGRMIWPLMYLIAVGAIAIVVRQFNRNWLTVLLSVALLIQVADASAAIAITRDYQTRLHLSSANSMLTGRFWECAAKTYSSVRLIEPSLRGPSWERIALWAVKHGISTRVVYVNRVSESAFLQARYEIRQMVQSGRYSENELYVVSRSKLPAVMKTLQHGDALVRVDGYNILAPGLDRMGMCLGSTKLRSIDHAP